MAAKVPEMSPDFARWYFELFMEEGPMRAARWKGVTQLAASVDEYLTEVLVRIVFASKAPGGVKNDTLAAAHGKVVAAFAANPSFDAEKSERELQLLAAATLLQLFPTNPDAALAITTACFGDNRKADLPMDLVGAATQALRALSSKLHARPDLAALRLSAPAIEFEVDEESVSTNTPEKWEMEIEALRDAVAETLRSVVDAQNRVTASLSRRIGLGDEELQMLWWLTGARSHLLNKRFNEVEPALAPFMLAQELGGMTSFSPGPASIGAILAKTGIGTEQMKVADAINAVAMDWAAHASSPSKVSPMTTPLHFALEKRVEVGDDKAWQAVWAAQTGLTADLSMPAIEIAEIFYREHLFLHVGG